jgi:hypothetical protein
MGETRWPVEPPLRRPQYHQRGDWVEIDLGLDDHNHVIKPEDRVNLAMAFRQP